MLPPQRKTPPVHPEGAEGGEQYGNHTGPGDRDVNLVHPFTLGGPPRVRRVAVFIDWQNVYHCAREAFHDLADPTRYGSVRPKAFSQLLVRKGDATDALVHIGIYRGEPDPRKDGQTHGAHMRQRQAWKDECGDILRVRSRSLRYPPGRPLSEAEEKGVDVQLAIDVMVMGLRDEYDLAIIATADTDLLPVLEGLLALRETTGKPDVAVIGWSGTSKHLKLDGVPVRWIGKLDYESVRDRTDFNIKPADRRLPRA